jgi:hypothetical protein
MGLPSQYCPRNADGRPVLDEASQTIRYVIVRG